MSTRARASAVFPQPLERVWQSLRDFTFPTHIDDVASVVVDDGESPFAVGAVRTVTWKSGEVRKHRLVALSDLHFSVSWELVFAEPPEETTAYESTIQLYRITENNSTLVSWYVLHTHKTHKTPVVTVPNECVLLFSVCRTYQYSADVSQDLIQFRQKELAASLAELRNKIGE
jgi:hypothetical protein